MSMIFSKCGDFLDVRLQRDAPPDMWRDMWLDVGGDLAPEAHTHLPGLKSRKVSLQ